MQEFEHIERSESLPLTARIAPLASVAASKAEAAAARPKRKSRPLSEAAALPAPLPDEPAAPAAPPAETKPAADEAQVRAEPAKPEPAVSGGSAQPPIVFPERIDKLFGSGAWVKPLIVMLMFAHAAFDLTALGLIYGNLESDVAHLIFN